MPSGPPDKFPLFLDTTGLTPTQIATALGAQYTNFFNTYGVWPNRDITVGTVVYFGAY